MPREITAFGLGAIQGHHKASLSAAIRQKTKLFSTSVHAVTQGRLGVLPSNNGQPSRFTAVMEIAQTLSCPCRNRLHRLTTTDETNSGSHHLVQVDTGLD